MQPHCLLATADVLTYFVEPHCAFADRLRERCGDGITAAPELRDLGEDDLRPVGGRGSDKLDPRLVFTLDALADSDNPLPNLAAQVGLSPQRLRALAGVDAIAAGFADQAHLTRQMREMMGLTPATLLPIVRPHSLRAT